MLLLRAISAGQARYYLNGPDPGMWSGSSAGLVDLRGPVEGAALQRLLRGLDPHDGSRLPDQLRTNRRDGFTLTFAAPKSVSILGAVTDTADADLVRTAHENAVNEALGFLERNAIWARRGPDRHRVATSGLVAARFGHATNWSGEPHTHTHLVVPNLVFAGDGRWSALDSRCLFQHRSSACAIYLAGLRSELRRLFGPLEWTRHPNGLWDLTGVGRPAIDACSRRHAAVLSAIDAPGPTSPRAQLRALGVTRTHPVGESRSWEQLLSDAGFHRQGAQDLLARAAEAATRPACSARPPALAGGIDPTLAGSIDPTLAGSIDTALSELGCTFAKADLVAVLATSAHDGGRASSFEDRAAELISGSARSPAGGDRWVSRGMQDLQEELEGLAERLNRRRLGIGAPWAVQAALEVRPELTDPSRAAVRSLTSSGHGVSVLGPGELMAQAAVLEAARSAWEMTGLSVAFQTGQDAARRWEALTGVASAIPVPGVARPGAAAPVVAQPAGERFDVVLVDRSDRLSTPKLARLIVEAIARGSKVVLIEGGTAPATRFPRNTLMGTLTALGRWVDPGPAPVLERAGLGIVESPGGRVAVSGSLCGATTALLGAWREGVSGQAAPTMVALGAAEVDSLNRAARAWMSQEGRLSGPEVSSRRRPFRVGDQVIALRHLGPIPAATVGTVVSADPRTRTVTIAWSARHEDRPGAGANQANPESRIGRGALEHLGYAYATTEAYLRSRPGRKLVLGDLSSPDTTSCRYLLSSPLRDGPVVPGPLATLLVSASARAPGSGPPSTAVQEPPPVDLSLGDLIERRDALAAGLREAIRHGPGERELGRLQQWARFEHAIALRTDALTRIAEVTAGSKGVLGKDVLATGPAPERGPERLKWRQGLRRLAIHQDRFGLDATRAALEGLDGSLEAKRLLRALEPLAIRRGQETGLSR